MLLSNLLVALSCNRNLYITLTDEDENALITFNATGYGSVESDLGERTVKKVKITSPNTATIVLEPSNP